MANRSTKMKENTLIHSCSHWS